MKSKLKSHERAKRGKNFLPTLILAILFWIGWGWLVYSTPPNSDLLLIAFYFLLFVASFLTTALLLANSRRGLLLAGWLTTFLVFRYYELGNILNILLLSGIVVSLEIYLSKN